MQLPPVPGVLLVGVGRFGRHHLAEWQRLQHEGRVRLCGVVVQSASSAATLRASTGLPVHTALSPEAWDGVDLVDIATPSATHAALVRQCLLRAHVLVEKPLAATVDEARELHALARRHGRVLATGHVYLHHPLSHALAEAAAPLAGLPHMVHIQFTNPLDTMTPGLDALTEWIHAFDLLGLCTPGALQACSAWRDGHTVVASLALSSGARAVVRVGWQGVERVRSVQLADADLQVKALYEERLLQVQRRDSNSKRWIDLPTPPLRAEIEAFVRAAAGQGPVTPDEPTVLRSLLLAERTRAALGAPRRAAARPDRPRVAVLGGGVFGATCAVELAQTCEVVLFERHPALLQEASWINQWRHHSGFHYPRSIDTIREVVAAKAEFESVYENVIVRDLEAYYAVSAFAREITPERYVATCRANGLRFEIVEPPPALVRPDRVSVCLKTDEAVVEIGRLSAQLMRSLSGHPHIRACIGTEVVGGRLLDDGRKQLTVAGGHGDEAPFDFVVNATYANRNRISGWFGFPQRLLRFDLMEMSVLRIPGLPKHMMTVLDGPFTSLTSTGHEGLFMLSGIHQSVLASQVTPDGLPPALERRSANREGLLAAGLRYLPGLEHAEHIESRIGVRTVEAYTDDFDGRPTVVTPHGFGCWSVLGGKIVTVVTNARHIAREIARQLPALPG